MSSDGFMLHILQNHLLLFFFVHFQLLSCCSCRLCLIAVAFRLDHMQSPLQHTFSLQKHVWNSQVQRKSRNSLLPTNGTNSSLRYQRETTSILKQLSSKKKNSQTLKWDTFVETMNHSFALAPIFQGSLLSGRELLQIQLVRRMHRNFQVLVVFFWVAILLGSDLCGRALHFKLPQASLSLCLSLPNTSPCLSLFLPPPLMFSTQMDGERAAWLVIALCSRVKRSQRPSFHHGCSALHLPPSFLFFLPHHSLMIFLFFRCLLSSLLLYNFSFVIFDKTFFFLIFALPPLTSLLLPSLHFQHHSILSHLSQSAPCLIFFCSD